MKQFKTIDLTLSVALILFGLIRTIAEPTFILYAYSITGGWQVISLATHAAFGWQAGRERSRNAYGWLVLIILGLGALGFLFYPIWMILAFPMLFLAPVMAIWYSLLCYHELEALRRRPLDILK